MSLIFQKTYAIATPRHQLHLECRAGLIKRDKIKTNKRLFSDLCKKGCPANFNKKYSCPPVSPDFKNYFPQNKQLLVLLLKIDLEQLANASYTSYHRLRIANAVLKSKIDKLMQALEQALGGRCLSSGACRLCRPCRKKLGQPCHHPDKLRFAPEALGVDCNQLTRDLFNLPLLWYKDKKAPPYTAVVSALLLPKSFVSPKNLAQKLAKEISLVLMNKK